MTAPNPNMAVEMQTDDGGWLPITLLPVNEWELARAAEELIQSLDEPQPWAHARHDCPEAPEGCSDGTTRRCAYCPRFTDRLFAEHDLKPYQPSATDWDDYTYHRDQERNPQDDREDMEADR